MSDTLKRSPSETAAPPTAVAAAGQKPAAKVSAESKAAVEPDKMRRRLIWACIWGYLGVNFLMFLRFFFPRTCLSLKTVFSSDTRLISAWVSRLSSRSNSASGW